MRRISHVTVAALIASTATLLAAPAGAQPAPGGATVVGAAGPACPSPAFSTIGAAVAAADPGDTIFVCAGTYSEVVVLTEGITLLGARWGEDARTRSGAETIIDAGGQPAAIVALTGSPLTIDGFTIRNAVRGTVAAGGAAAHRLENNIVTGNAEGFQFSGGTTSATIRHNLFEGNNLPGSGGVVSGTSIVFNTAAANNAVIEENTFEDNPGSPPGGDAADVNVIQGGSGVVIRGNTSGGGGSFAVLDGTPGALVTGNTVSDGAASTIVLFDGTSGTTISDNTVTAGTSSGVRDLSATGGFTITGNTLSGLNYGIRLQSPGSTVSGNTITGSATLDCEDTTQGDGTSGTANSWMDNVGALASPADICAPAPPEPPQPPVTTPTTTPGGTGGDPQEGVESGPGTLPATGGDAWLLALVGLSLVAGGLIVLRVRQPG